MRRLVFLAPGLALASALLVAGPVFSALLIGTNEPNTLIGTKNNDYLADTRIETSGAGTDTFNFPGVRGGSVSVRFIREWHKLLPEYASVTGPGGSIPFSSPDNAGIEKVVGGQGFGDVIETGGDPNTLMPGGGGSNTLIDYGGWTSASGVRDMPASNDTNKGFAASTGTDLIEDWGGTDVVEMRPLSTDDVYLSRRNFDLDLTAESLQIVTGPGAQVILLGHYDSYQDHTSCCGQQGRIEKVIFADATFTTSIGLSPAVSASAEMTLGKQATLAEAADQLAERRGHCWPRCRNRVRSRLAVNRTRTRTGQTRSTTRTRRRPRKRKSRGAARLDPGALSLKRPGGERNRGDQPDNHPELRA